MEGKKAKGASATTNNSITLTQRVKLIDWCKEHKDDSRSYDGLSTLATEELGFTVSVNCMQNHYTAVNGPRNNRQNGGTLAAKISVLEKRIAECERRLFEAGA